MAGKTPKGGLGTLKKAEVEALLRGFQHQNASKRTQIVRASDIADHSGMRSLWLWPSSGVTDLFAADGKIPFCIEVAERPKRWFSPEVYDEGGPVHWRT